MADEFLVVFNSKVDLTQAKIDVEKFKKSVEESSYYKIKLNVTTDLKQARSDFNAFKKEIKNDIENDSLKININFDDANSKLEKFKTELTNLLDKEYTLRLNIDSNVEQSLNRISRIVDSIRNSMNTVTQANDLTNLFTNQGARQNGAFQAQTQLNRLIEQFGRIQTLASSLNLDSSGIDDFGSKTQWFANQLESLNNNMKSVVIANEQMNEGLTPTSSGDIERYANLLSNLNYQLDYVSQKMAMFRTEVNMANTLSKNSFADKLETSLQNLNQYFEENQKSLVGFEERFEQVKNSMNNAVNVSQLNQALEMFKSLRQSVSDNQEMLEANRRAMASEISQQQKAFDSAKQQYDNFRQNQLNMLSDIEKYLTNTRNIPKELYEDFDKLSNSVLNADRYTNFGDIKNQFKDLQMQVKVYNNELKEAADATKKMEELELFNSRKEKSIETINQYLRENINLTNEDREELYKLQEAMKNATDTKQLAKANTDFATMKLRLKDVSNEYTRLSNILKSSLSQFAYMVSAAYLLRKAIMSVKDGINTVIELDDAMIELKKVTDETSETYDSFYKRINQTAKELGVATKEAIEATSSFAQMGFSLKEAEQLAKDSSILATISPEMDVAKSTDTIISVMKAFGIETNEVLDGIASKINYVGKSMPQIHYIG